MRYGFSKLVNLPYEKTIERITEELKKEGFGVLTSIDIKDTFKKKLNVEFGRYVILGACNPPFAFKALTEEPEIGLLLPCNVIIYEKGDATAISIFDPLIMAEVVENERVRPIAEEVRSRLQRVLENV